MAGVDIGCFGRDVRVRLAHRISETPQATVPELLIAIARAANQVFKRERADTGL
jgi:hypothetical protein